MFLILVLKLLPLLLGMPDIVQVFRLFHGSIQIEEVLVLDHLSEQLLHRLVEVGFVLLIDNHCLEGAGSDNY